MSLMIVIRGKSRGVLGRYPPPVASCGGLAPFEILRFRPFAPVIDPSFLVSQMRLRLYKNTSGGGVSRWLAFTVRYAWHFPPSSRMSPAVRSVK